MVAAYSPHGEAGGTLHFPSSPHIRHVDGASSALQHLRRSLSRSPSKGPVFRLVTSKSASPSPSSPLSPSRISAPYRSASTSLLSGPNVPQPSPLAIPYPPSAKRNRSTARKLSPMRLASRSRSSPRSPGRTTLSDLSDHGNATPRSSAGSSDDGENRIDGDAVDENTSGTAKALHPVDGQDEIKNRENGCVVPRAFARFEKHNGNVGSFAAKSSPLKRSDGIMNLDQANPGSPSAKRRSLHGSTFGPDFDIFDHEAACQGMSEFPSSRDGSHTECSALADHANVVSPMPRRTSSLRRTTLQQRYDKPLWARSRLNADVALECVTPGQSAPKNRFRMSLENFLPSLPRDSPFSSQGSLPNASVHPMFKQGPKSSHLGHQDRPQRHPLSRTITQSSSNSSMTDESPTHMPLRPGEPRKPLADFSKSLPVGASRPGSREAATSTISCQATSTEASFSTPENYKLAKPLPAAFMSTGLISKRHKDMEDMQPSFQGGKSVMPDTPCKRQSLVGASPPTMAPEKQIPRTRHVRHSFGMPSTPFNPQPTRPEPGTFGKGVSIFGSSFKGNNINRRGSFLSINSDDHSQSPPAQSQSQSSHEYELPPTPTKQFTPLGDAHARRAGGSANEQDSRVRECGPTGGSKPQLSEARQNCKFIPFGTSRERVDGANDKVVDASPPVALKLRSSFSIPSSFTRSRSLRNIKTPAPLSETSHVVPFPQSKKFRTKSSPLSPASPISIRPEQISPHTPRENIIPPDPSGLSISAQADGQLLQPNKHMRSSASSFPPATPTASRDSFPSFGNGRLSLHACNNIATVDVDPCLVSKFDKVELVGTGEFSNVYRVTKAQEVSAASGYFSLQTTYGSPKTPLPDRVWAVKKTRQAYIGPKDRQRKLQEVTVLAALRQSDHIIHFYDSWEAESHLYIQTEFCEEGSLDLFLDQVGRKARLDDFRIWKIMLEMSLVSPHEKDRVRGEGC